MGYGLFLKSPKREEQEVPDSLVTPLSNTEEADVEVVTVDELERALGVDDEENLSCENMYGQLSWDLMDWEEQPDEEREYKLDDLSNFFDEGHCSGMARKRESIDICDDYEQQCKMSLNLNLNYQEVMDAWSDRGHLLTNDCYLSMASTGNYMGEVPVMEEEKARREASVLRYKEKRQTRLFSKKIRYQVRKLNADKRPRLKGRFVKRGS